MNSLSWISYTREPCARLMNTGDPPTALKARTGEFTPPGINFCASSKACSEVVIIVLLVHINDKYSCTARDGDEALKIALITATMSAPAANTLGAFFGVMPPMAHTGILKSNLA